MTTYNWTTLQFRVEYADGSVDYIFAGGTVWGTFNPSYTTPVDKVPVALYIWAAASWAFPPIQVDIGQVSVTPVSAGQAVVSPAYGFSGEWWETDLNLLRARWYLPYLNQFISPDPIIPDYFKPQSLNQYAYALNNPVNYTDPSGHCVLCDLIIEVYDKTRGRIRILSGLDDRIDQSSPQIPFSNTAEATLLSLLGEGKAYLGGNAIAKIRQDPEMQAFERAILTDLRSDPRYRHEAFHKIYQPLNDLGEVRSLTFGGFGHPDPMIPDQLFHFYDPKYKPTWDAAKDDLTWLIRHASVKAVGNAAKQGHILIRYRLKDTLDLIVHENEAWNSPYNLVVRPLGFGYHTVLRGTAMEIEGYWSVRIKAVPPLYPCLLP